MQHQKFSIVLSSSRWNHFNTYFISFIMTSSLSILSLSIGLLLSLYSLFIYLSPPLSLFLCLSIYLSLSSSLSFSLSRSFSLSLSISLSVSLYVCLSLFVSLSRHVLSKTASLYLDTSSPSPTSSKKSTSYKRHTFYFLIFILTSLFYTLIYDPLILPLFCFYSFLYERFFPLWVSQHILRTVYTCLLIWWHESCDIIW